MKLYSLLEDIILEAVKMTSIGVHGVPNEEMINNILLNPSRVTIMYQGENENTPSERQIDVIASGNMKGGTHNYAIRVYQPFGYSTSTGKKSVNRQTGEESVDDGKGFKTLLVNRISYWQPTNLKLWNTNAYDSISGEIGRINKTGDGLLTNVKIAKFVNPNMGPQTKQQQPVQPKQPIQTNKQQPIQTNKQQPTQKTYNNITNPNNKQIPTKTSKYEN